MIQAFQTLSLCVYYYLYGWEWLAATNALAYRNNYRRNKFYDTGPGWDKILARLDYLFGLVTFHSTCKILFGVYLKHSSLFSSADIKPMSNDLVHVIACECIYSLSLWTQRSLCFHPSLIFVDKDGAYPSVRLGWMWLTGGKTL
jgi:hypothetical protein